MQTIERKSMIRKSDVEYADYAINHVLGCAHGCNYPCYAFMLMKRFGVVKSYEDWIQPKIVSNTLEILDKEIPKFKDKINSVHLCFSTDPFMYGYDEVTTLSLKAIEKLNNAGIKCTVLTKGILPPELANFSPDNEYAISLVSTNEYFRQKYEPNSAPYSQRLEALDYLSSQGCKTWVSIEPYPTPNICEQSLWFDVLDKIWYVQKIVFGRWNYNKNISEYPKQKEFYAECVEQLKDFCRNYKIQLHIKKGTLEVKENVD
jgi:DNA repair photolyase